MKKFIVALLALCLVRVDVQITPSAVAGETWCRSGDISSPCRWPVHKILVTLRTDLFREEKFSYVMASTLLAAQTRRIRPIYIHCKPDQGYDERFDTVLMVNGSVAVLNQLTKSVLGYPGLAIDESYPGANLEGRERAFVFERVCKEVERALAAGEEPVVYCTLLYYNARGSLALLRELKRKFGPRVRTGVGGQLVATCFNAYRSGENASFIDQVAVGDAEVCLEQMLAGKPFVVGRKKVTTTDHYTPPFYGDESYLGLAERLDEMSRYQFGDITGIRQLITESVRGCSWAYGIGKPCNFCSLDGVTERPVFRDLEAHFRIEQDLAEKFQVNWLFDVSNQFLPVIKPAEQVEWLKHYVAARKRFNALAINRYVYLTTNSITADTAPLLREAGVRCAYIGIDGWDTTTKRAMHKTLAPHERALEVCKANGIYVRTSLVIGSGLTPQNLDDLPRFVKNTMERFGGKPILSFGNFLEIVLPGSPDWANLRREAFDPKNSGNAVPGKIRELYRRFETQGYLALEEQELLNELRIRHTQPLVEYEAVVAARDKAAEAVKKSETISITIRECEKLEKS